MMRVERDVAKYKREMQKWRDTYNDDGTLKAESQPGRTLLGDAIEGLEYGYETLEDYFAPKSKFTDDTRQHEPVLYDIVHSKEEQMQKEPIRETFNEFIRRSERLLDVHMQRAAVNDGLAGLSDREILYKVREVPTKIKKHMRQLNLRL